MAQNKSKRGASTTPQSAPAKQTASVAGMAKARRIESQKAAELRNKELRAQGLPTPDQIARQKRSDSRIALQKQYADKQRQAAASSKKKETAK